jgi:hypothetical protein
LSTMFTWLCCAKPSSYGMCCLWSCKYHIYGAYERFVLLAYSIIIVDFFIVMFVRVNFKPSVVKSDVHNVRMDIINHWQVHHLVYHVQLEHFKHRHKLWMLTELEIFHLVLIVHLADFQIRKHHLRVHYVQLVDMELQLVLLCVNFVHQVLSIPTKALINVLIVLLVHMHLDMVQQNV